MEVVRSNRTEVLANALADRVLKAPLGPFAKEALVVQSLGMERWLTLELSETLGIWGNPSFPFPRAIVEQILEDLEAGASDEAKAYDPGRLKWTIAELLRESSPAELRAYLGDPPDLDRVLRLASTMSNVFDRYVVHRASLLRRWERGGEGHWQAELWRRVAQRLGPHDLARRVYRALETLRSSPGRAPVRYERIHLFSLETLPPLFVELFGEVSWNVPTVLYLLEPSSEYVSNADTAPQLSLPIEEDVQGGHPLLIRLGELSRDFQSLLLTMDPVVQDEHDLFSAPGRRDLLSSLQTDILEFRAPPEPGSRSEVRADDRSIAIHECPGPMREVQVLHDQIRAALEDDPSLRPEDIVVMTPDLDTYAPLFRAVFGQPDPKRIPYDVHDRRTRDDASFYDDFSSVLEVIDSRFSVLDVLRLIDAASFREEYCFDPEERARLAQLLEEIGVRWGIDGAHRVELGFPDEPMHTWRASLERLFLGFTRMPDVTDAFEGTLPRGAPSLGDAELVARLAHLCELLFEFQSQARRPTKIGSWALRLESLCSTLFGEDDQSTAPIRIFRSALEEMKAAVGNDRFSGAISLATMRRELVALLRLSTPAVGFLRRGVTLSELVPLRSVPFRVVCLLGMGEEAFPRGDDRPSFDQTRIDHNPGDRNNRDDDRHSFLQAVLCARDRLIIAYSAPTTSSRSEANPSPVLWELCECVDRFYRKSDHQRALEPIVHPVHAFDTRYFEDSELPRSSSTRHLEIAKAIGEPAEVRARVELRSGAGRGEAPTRLSAGELSKWLWNPAREFIRRVLEARFESSTLYEPTHALTTLTPLAAARVGGVALDGRLRDETLTTYLRAAPEFPDGTAGNLQRNRLAREIGLVDRARAAASTGLPAHSVRVSAEVGGLSLQARLGGIHGKHRVVTRFTRPRRRAELEAWIEHLLMRATGRGAATTELVLRGDERRPTQVSFEDPDDPPRVLDELVSVYSTCREHPLPLFEGVSWTFAEKHAEKGLDDAVRAARRALSAQRNWDESLEYVLGPDDPFDDAAWVDAFHDASLRVYGALLQHRRER